MGDMMKTSWRNDAVAKVTGRTKYTDDSRSPNALHAVPVYADHVHAILRGIDTKAASGSAWRGTRDHGDGCPRHEPARTDREGFPDIRRRQDPLSWRCDRHRRGGDAGSRRSMPPDSCRWMRFRCTPVLDPEEAMKDGSPLVHEEFGTNIINTHRVRRGQSGCRIP